MIATTTRWREQVERSAAQWRDEDLKRFVSEQNLQAEDDLADLIDTDGRARISAGREVELSRYVVAVPRLSQRAVLLDTAIEITLRAMRQRGMRTDEAALHLRSRHPEFETQIRTAEALDEVMGRSSVTEGRGLRRARLSLPCLLGPAGPDGKPRYEARDLLGAGGQGSVYLGIDRALSRPEAPAWVAIKVVALPTGDKRERSREALNARLIDHPNVVRVHDRGEAPGGLEFVVYEYVAGTSLVGVRAAKAGQVDPAWAADLILTLARGLQSAHNVGVIHRDLKPSNVLVSKDEVCKIADFGLATAPQSDQVEGPGVGSLGFVSPEQYAGASGGLMPPTDVYGLGGTLYWLLTDLAPNGLDAAQAVARLARGVDAPTCDPRDIRPDVPRDLALICRRALEPDPTKRYAAAAAMAQDLEAFLAFEPIAWTKPRTPHRIQLLVRRSPIVVAAAALGTLLTVASVTGWAWAMHRSSVERADAARDVAELDLKLKVATQNSAMESARYSTLQTTVSSMINMTKPDTPRRWLTSAAIFMTIFSPEDLHGKGDDWALRIERLKHQLEQDRASGHGGDLETVVWETLYSLWSYWSEDYTTSASEAATALSHWKGLLKPEDPWLLHVEAILIAAEGMRDLNAGADLQVLVDYRARLTELAPSVRNGGAAFAIDNSLKLVTEEIDRRTKPQGPQVTEQK